MRVKRFPSVRQGWRAGAVSRRARLLPAVLLFLAAVAGNAGAADYNGESRIWTSQAGSQFEASLTSIGSNGIVLAGTDDVTLTVMPEQLSDEDRRYLLELQRRRHRESIDYYREGRFLGADLPGSAEVEGLKHVTQRENYCVPASAEMVLRFYGHSHDQVYLAEITSRDSARSAGTSFADLMHAMRAIGIESVSIRSNSVAERMRGIRAAIADGRPVLVSYRASDTGHAVVAVGYDDRRRAFSVLDPMAGGRPQRLDYRFVEDYLTGVVVVIPEPAEIAMIRGGNGTADGNGDGEFLRKVSGVLRNGDSSNPRSLVSRFEEAGVSARWRNFNRRDLALSQGQTRSFARRDGVDLVRQVLDRGRIVVAPQDFDGEPGLILMYGLDGNDFRAVEYFADGTFVRGTVRPLDFSLRWIWRDQGRFLLPVIEVDSF